MNELNITETKLGYGGYSTVYLGSYYKTPVAVKIINKLSLNSFHKEAEILRYLHCFRTFLKIFSVF